MHELRRAAAFAVTLAWGLFPAGRTAFAVGSTDYVATATSGLYEAPPSGAAAVGSSTATGARADPPFEFPYFGVLYDHVYVTIGSYILFGNDTTTASLLPSDPSTVAPGSTPDGACSPLWMGIASGSLASTYKWTAGTAPNRRFIISFENVAPYSGGSARMTYQVRLFEGSGRIEFAYKPDIVPSTWSGIAYSIGMVAPGTDPRWFAPVNTSTTNTGHPANDYAMDPRVVTIGGRLMYDRLTPNAQGWGTATTPAAASSSSLDVLYADGRPAARGSTDASGYFQFAMLPSAAGVPVDLFAYTRGPAVVVRPPASGVHSRRVVQGFNGASDATLGTVIVDAASDPTAAFRGPMNVSSVLNRLHAAASPLFTSTIPQINVFYDAAGAAATAYAPGSGPATASMTVAGPSAPNPDAWDDGVIDRVYGRHVLASIAPRQVFPADDRLDAATEPTNAFAVAFGCSLYAAFEGKGAIVDSTSEASATVFDLETPMLASPKGTDVAGWVAAALYDLVDAANETSDWTDGTTGAAATDAYVLVSTMTVIPDAKQFYLAWVKSGRDALALSRTFIAHGLLADDASEPNDEAAESAAFGAVGTRKDGLVLNAGNEDWFTLVVPNAVDDARADVGAVRSSIVSTIELTAFAAGGGVLADKVDSGQGPVQLTIGPLSAGSYRIRVKSVAGDAVPTYTLQASNRLRISHTALQHWTSGRAYAQNIAVSGGIAPLLFQVQSGAAPPGLVFDAALGRVSGVPSKPGVYDFSLAVLDSGNPAHVDVWPQHVVIAEPLAFDLGKFVGFPSGRAVDVVREHVGGTAPLVVSLSAGALPPGLSLSPGSLGFTGTTSAPGAYPMTISGVDAAGSPTSTSPIGVVCVALTAKKTPVDLAAHAPACGFFFDAVAGSKTTIAVVNAPRVKVRRPMTLVVLGPDGLPVAGGKIKVGKGRAAAAAVPAPITGRYYAIVDAADGDDEPLLATAVVKPPTKTTGTIAALQPGTSVEIEFGALAGAKLSFTARPDRLSGESLSVATLRDPSGDFVPLDGIATTKGTAALLTTQLAKSGTWKIRLAAKGGTAGKATYVIKLIEPKGVTFSAD
jgi:hypothetical protein